MNNHLASWTTGMGAECQGGAKKNATWAEVFDMLTNLKQKCGTVTIDIIDATEIGPQSLQLQTENGYSVISLGEDNGEDYVVRSFSDGLQRDDLIEVLGNRWESRQVCTYFDLVVAMFKEFMETGNVSNLLLN